VKTLNKPNVLVVLAAMFMVGISLLSGPPKLFFTIDLVIFFAGAAYITWQFRRSP
jgi:protein-S-isoprenylcysteine O-methyltransferase Ste14